MGRHKGEQGRRSWEAGVGNCRHISVQLTDRYFVSENAFMHEASRLLRYDACVACLIKKAAYFWVWRDEDDTLTF